MERTNTNSANINIYSYQASVNNQQTETNNRINSNSYILSNQALSEFARTQLNDHVNLEEILQNATDDSNDEEGISNQDNDDMLYRDIDYNFIRDQSLLSNDNTSNISSGDDLFDTKFYIKQPGRASSAPTKPNNEAEEFKYSSQFISLEKVVQCSSGLIMKSDGKFDVESEEGAELFKVFLDRLEVLIKTMKTKNECREYRANFSQAYRHLYKEGQLCYLTEILDSAQEGIPCLWVNSEKYNFSKEVLESGIKLYETFCNLLVTLRSCYNNTKSEDFYDNYVKTKKDLKNILELFDRNWVNYEKVSCYIC